MRNLPSEWFTDNDGQGLVLDPERVATALTAKDKEIEALRVERDKFRKALDQQTQVASEQFCRAETAERNLKQVTDESDELRLQFTNLCQEFDIRNDELRAAERERDQARAALKQISDGYGPNHGSKFCRDVAARAVIEQGE